MKEDVDYYLDLDYLSEFCSVKVENTLEPSENEENAEKEEKIQTISSGIDVFKYDIIKMCLERIIYSGDSTDPDRSLLSKNDEDTESYKIAFNTLLVHKIIKIYEREY